MKIQTTRFGELDVADETLIELSSGMVGFPSDTKFAWIAHRNSRDVAWIQSVTTANLAFPLINAANIAAGYPDIPVNQIADQAGLEFESDSALALMVVIAAAPGGPPTVNLIAPVVINSETRKGAQVVLTNSRFTTATIPPPDRQKAASGETR
jgi:flagellar assembly factor FliW